MYWIGLYHSDHTNEATAFIFDFQENSKANFIAFEPSLEFPYFIHSRVPTRARDCENLALLKRSHLKNQLAGISHSP